MKNKSTIITIIIAIALIIGSFFGGWYLRQYYNDKDNNTALDKATSFSVLINESNLDSAYNALSESAKQNKSADDFKNEFKAIKDESLQSGVVQVYESGNSYLINQGFVDSNGESKKILILNVDKVDGDFVITSYALS